MAPGEQEELPPPSSGLFLEVSFRRLLASCEEIAGGASAARPDLVATWRRSPVFHHYIETLQAQLADLEASAGSRLPRHLLEQYSAHVEALASQLQPPDVPAFCSSVAAQPAALAGQPASVGQPAAAGLAAPPPAVPRPVVVPPPPVARTPQLPPPAKPQHEVAAAPARAQAAAPAAPAAAGERASQPPAGPSGRLQTQQQLHEDLTEELAGLASRLKTNTLAIEGKLKEREQLLDSTETALDTSVQRTRASKEAATRIHKRGRANFCLTCLVMLVVGVAFAAMYVFIKVTRLAGYRAAAPTLAPAAPVPGGMEPGAPPEGVPTLEDHYAEL